MNCEIKFIHFDFLEDFLKCHFQADSFQLFPLQGIYISKIIPGGSAAATGKLRMGDRILAVNETNIRSVSHQEAVMSLLQPCEIIKLTVQHDPLPAGFVEITVNKQEGEKLGMIVKGGLRGQPGNPQDQSDEGVFCVKVNPDSIASTDPRIKVDDKQKLDYQSFNQIIEDRTLVGLA